MSIEDLPPVPHRSIASTLAGVGFAVLVPAATGLILGLKVFGSLDPTAGWSIALGLAAALGIAVTWLLVASPLHKELGVSTVRSQTSVMAFDQLESLLRIEDALDASLCEARTQAEVVQVAMSWLGRLDRNRPVEVHLIHPRRDVLELVAVLPDDQPLMTADAATDESLALNRLRTLTYATTAASAVCDHLASRHSHPVSAVAIPLHVGGQRLGVLYATGPAGMEPSAISIQQLERFGRRLSARLAAVPAEGVGFVGQRAVGDNGPDVF